MEDWIGQHIRRAHEQGAFDDLPGAGKPIPDLDKSWSADEWVVRWAKREGADLTLALPPALALRKERQELPDVLASRKSEQAVRDSVDAFNERLRQAYRRPQEGPPLTVAPVDVEQAVQRWRTTRPAAPPDPTPAPAPADQRNRRRWPPASGGADADPHRSGLVPQPTVCATGPGTGLDCAVNVIEAG
ncbi:DUF1992 domain-containing protein [Vallicoccus soli]|uniref:DUF1992 domain-containing protein n=2 Tax=Vallicoccus soli TaxID=2339232 RepID=A0A3A3Z0U0_9ACTN|nr:DUF1992 domain-containing protein [Vallicoccus soli]